METGARGLRSVRRAAGKAARTLLLLTPLLAVPAVHAADANSAAAVLECMRGNVPKSLTVRDIQLTAVDRAGSTRTMQGRIYVRRNDDKLQAMVRIASPADLAGAAYLLRERDSGDEMYVYMPALAKVRRISGAAVDGSLWGTDLSYGDIKQLSNAFSGSQARLDKDETFAGRATHVLSLAPSTADSVRFDRLRAWIDSKTCMAIRVDFELGGTAQKRLTVEPRDLQQSGTYWYATQATVSDLKEGSKTTVKLTGVVPDKEIADRLFNPGTFYVGG